MVRAAENWASMVCNILASMLSGISVSTLLMIFCLTSGQSVKLSNVYSACDLLKNTTSISFHMQKGKCTHMQYLAYHLMLALFTVSGLN